MARSPGRWILTTCCLNGGAVAIIGLVSILDMFIFHRVSSLSELPIRLSEHDRYRDKGLTVIGVHSLELITKEKSKTFAAKLLHRRFTTGGVV